MPRWSADKRCRKCKHLLSSKKSKARGLCARCDPPKRRAASVARQKSTRGKRCCFGPPDVTCNCMDRGVTGIAASTDGKHIEHNPSLGRVARSPPPVPAFLPPCGNVLLNHGKVTICRLYVGHAGNCDGRAPQVTIMETQRVRDPMAQARADPLAQG